MNDFLAAQADDPFDPAPMLIHADWLEEHGDGTAAAVFRDLERAGFASLAVVALSAGSFSVLNNADRLDPRGVFHGAGPGSAIGSGAGDGFGVGHGQGHWREENESATGNRFWSNGDGHGERDGDGGDLRLELDFYHGDDSA